VGDTGRRHAKATYRVRYFFGIFHWSTSDHPCHVVPMPKSSYDFDPESYAPVAARVELFYEKFPAGRILTELVQHTDQQIVFRAAVYRTADDRAPAATGWAAERVGDGEINAVACLENTETSAIGRALANLGFLASRLRPSAEEATKAARARPRLGAEPDLHQLLRTAERAGLDAERLETFRSRVARGLTPAELAEVQHELRRFIQRRMEDHAARAGRGP
jgi:hypothetical protein